MDLDALLDISHRYGGDEEYVLAGGGNTSYKESGVLYVKGSGTQLADIKQEQFVAMDMRKLREMPENQGDPEMSEDERETRALAAMMAARLPGEEHKRPSVESVLHALFIHKLVLHVHPALVNGMTCSIEGEKTCHRLFGEEAIWINLTKPGLVLAQVCKKAFEKYTEHTGRFPQLVFLQNHGIFVAADSVGEIDELMKNVKNKLGGCIVKKPDFSAVEPDKKLVSAYAPALRMLYAPDGMACVQFCVNKQVLKFVSDATAFKPVAQPFTPDHIVYCKDEPLFLEKDADIAAAFNAYTEDKGYKPGVVAVRGLGFFALGRTRKDAVQSRELFLDAVKIATYTSSFGGAMPLPPEFARFVLGWEAEQYRIKASSGSVSGGRLAGKIAIVTGSAQGFGRGIAEKLVAEGASVTIADLKYEGAQECARQLCSVYGPNRAIALAADVSDEESVLRMVQDTVIAFGGLDILVSNAGVLIAGGLSEMSKKNFDFVTKVNYSGYFLCVKHASEPMKIQHKYAPGYLMDIIEINSKSGLEGSNKNFAYAGSKFGGIGLTQSFALELVEYGIKVNAVCPGNLLDGPLWSDPKTGLFRQYLDSGKVAGAKTIDDVRKFYEAKVPMKRGCAIEDVVRAILYVIEQKYETGQAVPVTGGQVMLR